MTWTSEPPTKPGWYFYQRIEDDGKVFPVRCGYVDKQYYPYVQREEMTLNECDTRKCKNYEPRHACSLAICDMDTPFRWAGPIEEPSHEMV